MKDKSIKTIVKLRSFDRWAKAEKVDSSMLQQAVNEIQSGLIDVNLGQGLIKKRVAKAGQGKRGGYRTLLAFEQDKQVIFLFGFAKNEQGNVSKAQLAFWKKLAKHYLALDAKQVNRLIKKGDLIRLS